MTNHLRIAHHHFLELETGARGRREFRLEQDIGEIHAEDRGNQAERVGHAVAESRVVVADRADRGLECRRARQCAGKQAGDMRRRDREGGVGHIAHADGDKV